MLSSALAVDGIYLGFPAVVPELHASTGKVEFIGKIEGEMIRNH